MVTPSLPRRIHSCGLRLLLTPMSLLLQCCSPLPSFWMPAEALPLLVQILLNRRTPFMGKGCCGDARPSEGGSEASLAGAGLLARPPRNGMVILEVDKNDDANIANHHSFEDHCVPHIMQKADWDCGLACVAMVLKGLGIDRSIDELVKECGLTSVWTVDLAFLLRQYDPDFTYYTNFLGSRKEYQDQRFYKATFDEDEKRVNRLFLSAKSCSVHIVRMMLPLDDYRRFLYCQQYAIIALVNAKLLWCQLCKERKNCFLSMCGKLANRIRGDEYAGHYITLIGYDPTEDLFIYRDPDEVDSYCTIAADRFDNARRSKGTDNDCIVIKL
ncbi:Guanylylate cyclase-domain-containing protein [Dichotomocladium elegans]|nr:Guanylylate cyclase-domain-containing protein [Dichotomocladium elegans]